MADDLGNRHVIWVGVWAFVGLAVVAIGLAAANKAPEHGLGLLWVAVAACGLLFILAVYMCTTPFTHRWPFNDEQRGAGGHVPTGGGPNLTTPGGATYSGLDYPGGFGASVWSRPWWQFWKPEVVWVEPRNPPGAPPTDAYGLSVGDGSGWGDGSAHAPTPPTADTRTLYARLLADGAKHLKDLEGACEWLATRASTAKEHKEISDFILNYCTACQLWSRTAYEAIEGATDVGTATLFATARPTREKPSYVEQEYELGVWRGTAGRLDWLEQELRTTKSTAPPTSTGRPNFGAELRRFHDLDRDYDGSPAFIAAIDQWIEDVRLKLAAWSPRNAERFAAYSGFTDGAVIGASVFGGRKDVLQDPNLKRLHVHRNKLVEIMGDKGLR